MNYYLGQYTLFALKRVLQKLADFALEWLSLPFHILLGLRAAYCQNNENEHQANGNNGTKDVMWREMSYNCFSLHCIDCLSSLSRLIIDGEVDIEEKQLKICFRATWICWLKVFGVLRQDVVARVWVLWRSGRGSQTIMELPSGKEDICKEVDAPPAQRLVRARFGPLVIPAVSVRTGRADLRLLFRESSWVCMAMWSKISCTVCCAWVMFRIVVYWVEIHQHEWDKNKRQSHSYHLSNRTTLQSYCSNIVFTTLKDTSSVWRNPPVWMGHTNTRIKMGWLQAWLWSSSKDILDGE